MEGKGILYACICVSAASVPKGLSWSGREEEGLGRWWMPMTPNANGIPCPPLQKKTNHRLSLPTPCSGSSLSTGGWWSRVPRVGCGAILSNLGWGRACLPGMTSISSPDPSHPPHPALVPWTHFPGGEPAANWTAGPGGWVRGWTGWSNRPVDQRDPRAGTTRTLW